MESDMWLILAVFCFLVEAIIGALQMSGRDVGRYGGLLLPLGLAFFAISFLSMVTRSA